MKRSDRSPQRLDRPGPLESLLEQHESPLFTIQKTTSILTDFSLQKYRWSRVIMQTCFLSAKQGNFSADLNVIAISSLFDKSREGRKRRKPTMKLHKTFLAIVIALGLFAFQALPALACGGLIAPDGDVHLARATTFVAWHGGIEHYLTSFTYQGNVTNLGWIVPLPAVPIKVEEGGAWTLQRLDLEAHPILQRFGAVTTAASSADQAQVLEQVKIEALNITVLRGSGQAVLNWASSNNFFLNDETRNHFLTYPHARPFSWPPSSILLQPGHATSFKETERPS